MATPSEKLAQSLDVLHELQDSGQVAIRSGNLSRTHRERLLKNGFIQEVMRGWYIPSRLDDGAGKSTAWYTSYWNFCAAYLSYRFNSEWCVSPEQSISLHTGNLTVPKQLFVRAPGARNRVTQLPHNTSLFESRSQLPENNKIQVDNDLRIYQLSEALIACSPRYYLQNTTDLCAALVMIRDASEILEPLLEGGHSTIAARLAAAFRHIGRAEIADEIFNTMKSAGYDIREKENNPFQDIPPITVQQREPSPYVNRVRLMWQVMRESIIHHFPESPGKIKDSKIYLKDVVEAYTSDAYHSLSIEGYIVSKALIEQVRSGHWNPDNDETDAEHKDALAARGYWQAFQSVKQNIAKILAGDPAARVVEKGHRDWYREMFSPSVIAGIIKASDLAGYRNSRVYIRHSMHTPPSEQAVRDLMPVYFELLKNEANPAVRVVLGHFIFVYIHPYMDGNGRMGRFLMNTMLASGGYPWTVIPLDKWDEYMSSLEEASVNENIVPFSQFLAHLVAGRIKGESMPPVG